LFLPHLLPVDAGIHETIVCPPADGDVTQADLYEAFHDAYADQPFVRVRGEDDVLPNVKFVVGTNCVDIAVRLTASGQVVVLVAEDNLIKGASGQAIQNMNGMFEIDETAGLI
jgi:N-acetyl-gamma-glutamyl-phosphate reductase